MSIVKRGVVFKLSKIIQQNFTRVEQTIIYITNFHIRNQLTQKQICNVSKTALIYVSSDLSLIYIWKERKNYFLIPIQFFLLYNRCISSIQSMQSSKLQQKHLRNDKSNLLCSSYSSNFFSLWPFWKDLFWSYELSNTFRSLQTLD